MLTVEGVSKEFHSRQGSSVVLRDVSFGVEQGEFVVLEGASGSGKSTLISILGLIEPPSSGQLHFLGNSVADMTPKQLELARKSHIGIIFQSFNLMPSLTAIENVMLPLYIRKVSRARQKALASLKQVAMDDCINKRPSQLSGGQQQRVAIARAFVTNPDFILADEPTANLDRQNSEVIFSLLSGLNKASGASVFLATHELDLPITAYTKYKIYDGSLQIPG